jgi:hypothetical protein
MLPTPGDSFGQKLEDLDGVLGESSYEFICGDSLFGLEEDPVPHPSSTNGFIVKRSLTCRMPIERQYFASTQNFAPICAICGEENLQLHLGYDAALKAADGMKSFPICLACFKQGQKPVACGRMDKIKRKRKKGAGVLLPLPPAKKRETMRSDPDHKPTSSVKPTCSIQNFFSPAASGLVSPPVTTRDLYDRLPHSKAVVRSFGGLLVNVPGDGNCGYHAVREGLQYLGIPGEECSVTDFRRAMREHAEEFQESLFNQTIATWYRYQVAMDAEGRRKWWHEEVLPGIYTEGVSYREGAPRPSWMCSDDVLPIICQHKFKVNVVVYSISNDSNGNPHVPSTWTFFKGDDGIFCYTIHPRLEPPAEQIQTSTSTQPTMYLLHISMNHYMFLKL